MIQFLTFFSTITYFIYLQNSPMGAGINPQRTARLMGSNNGPWMSVVGTVGKISAFRPQGPRFDPGFAEVRKFVQPSFQPKPTQLSILPG